MRRVVDSGVDRWLAGGEHRDQRCGVRLDSVRTLGQGTA